MDEVKKLSFRLIVRGMGTFVLFAAVLFLFAGRLSYWQGWVYFGTNVLAMIVTLFLFRNDPAFVIERQKPGPGIKSWDKVYMAFSSLFFLISAVLGGLDAGRFHWTEPIAAGPYAAGLVFYAAGQGLFLWAKRSNRFFSSMVRIQTDRGHSVCQGGPYRWIRHPGYVGGLLYIIPAGMLLGSWLAALPQVLASIALIIRTALEDRTLRAELPGYAAYAERVRWRLLPGVW
ncbi:MAG: isoprenylcysteine carboxylmethyltransferase family protein [Acidobacteriota bacterium]|nr:isoprenylcysteine carboxylmethyltransferase family protein [Acidobacteriota bacterium]